MASKKASSGKKSGSHAQGGGKGQTKRRSLSEQPAQARSGSLRAAQAQAQGARQGMLTPRLKNDIVGVVVVAVAVMLMIAVCMDSQAVITSWVSNAMHFGFGVGAYILPVMVGLFGICFFMLGRHDLVLSRIALGMGLIFLSVVALYGVNAPGAANHVQALFAEDYLLSCGGYVGNGLAYVLLSLVGQTIAWILLAAIIVGSLVLIGFSISGFFDWLLACREDRKERKREEEYVAPYSRARGLDAGLDQTDMAGYGRAVAGAGAVAAAGAAACAGDAAAGGVGGFVPAGSTTELASAGGRRGGGRASGEGAGKTRMLRGAGKTRVLGDDAAGAAGAAAAAAAQMLEGVAGAAATGAAATRMLDGSDSAGAEPPVAGDVAAAAAPEVEFADSMDGADAAKAMAAVAAAGAVAAGKGSKAAKGKKAGKSADAAPNPLLADGDAQQAEEGEFTLPDPKFLKKSALKPRSSASNADLAEMGARLQETLHEFNVDADVVGWVHGPTVTLFKVSLASGVRVNKITALSDDIALAFASQSVRIFSPIAGTSLVGIEIPNDSRENVLLGDVLPPAGTTPMLMGIGKDVEGNAITADLAKMPHLLIGGTTGSGKSVAINSMIMSVLMRARPDEVRMILIDPKRVELSLYNDIPHLFVPVVTDPHKAASTLAWAVQEMERRLKLFEEVGARNIAQYSKLRADALEEQEKRRAEIAERCAEIEAQRDDEGMLEPVLLAELAELEDEEFDEWEHMPSMMIVIDELADLMMVAGKEVETSISRIAQLARAAGIHMIVATQRPSTNVITGLIKANITNRIAFNVASGIDSRVILDTTGAEHLIGLGDLLFSKPEFGKPLRVQGCFVGEDEINKVCKFLREQAKPDYHEDIFTTSVPLLDDGGSGGGSGSGGSGSDEDLLWEAAEIVVGSNLGSTSALQRRLKVGYARAGRIMDMLEDKGIVGPANGSKPREVYVDQMELESLKAMAQHGAL